MFFCRCWPGPLRLLYRSVWCLTDGRILLACGSNHAQMADLASTSKIKEREADDADLLVRPRGTPADEAGGVLPRADLPVSPIGFQKGRTDHQNVQGSHICLGSLWDGEAPREPLRSIFEHHPSNQAQVRSGAQQSIHEELLAKGLGARFGPVSRRRGHWWKITTHSGLWSGRRPISLPIGSGCSRKPFLWGNSVGILAWPVFEIDAPVGEQTTDARRLVGSGEDMTARMNSPPAQNESTPEWPCGQGSSVHEDICPTTVTFPENAPGTSQQTDPVWPSVLAAIESHSPRSTASLD
jgi:hypothetical protein